jgi:hypothetical protein
METDTFSVEQFFLVVDKHKGGWPIQTRFWLEWGCSHLTDLVRTYRLDCPHAMGTDTISAERAKSFRHILVSFGAGPAALRTLC